jgi:hypothetical protein
VIAIADSSSRLGAAFAVPGLVRTSSPVMTIAPLM